MRPHLLLLAAFFLTQAFAAENNKNNKKEALLKTNSRNVPEKLDPQVVGDKCEDLLKTYKETEDDAPISKEEYSMLGSCKNLLEHLKIWDSSSANQRRRQELTQRLVNNERLQTMAAEAASKVAKLLIRKNRNQNIRVTIITL